MLAAAAISPVARALLIATAVVWVVLELRQSTARRTEAARKDRGSRALIGIAIFVGELTAGEATRRVPSADIGHRAVVAWIALGILWCGLALRFWSFRTLGRYFTFTVQTSGDQPVITDGPYRVIRHPGYAALLLAIIGIGLAIGNWLALASLTIALGGALMFRIHIEEQALLVDLGDRYRDYAATHKRLIPFIW